jgi:hypothetical protein
MIQRKTIKPNNAGRNVAMVKRLASWAGELSRIPIMAVHAGGEALDFAQETGKPE